MIQEIQSHTCFKEIDEHFSNIKDADFIKKAFSFAFEAHYGQQRKSGEAFIEHPVCTARRVCYKFDDTALTAAALLHDVLEDCPQVKREDLYKEFGSDVGFLVDTVSKNFLDFLHIKEPHFTEYIDKLLWAGMKDVRVLILKLADREHNLETLQYLKDKKQVRMAFETQAIYSPLKNILSFDSPLSLPETEQIWENFLNTHKIENHEELKSYLFKETFSNINNDSFKIAYKNSSNIIWRVEGLDMYKKICSLQCFKGKIEVLSVSSNGRWLHADFKFKKGVITPKQLKMSMYSFKT